MNRIRHLVIAMIVLGVSVAVFAQRRDPFGPAGKAPGDRADLLNQLYRMETRIAKLEEEVRELRGRRNVITVPAVPAPGRPLPPGWQEREFNGMQYYIIPCEASAAAPTTRPSR